MSDNAEAGGRAERERCRGRGTDGGTARKYLVSLNSEDIRGTLCLSARTYALKLHLQRERNKSVFVCAV